MTELETWLIGEATSITDIEFLTRVIILIVIVNVFVAVASELAKVGR